MKSLILILAVMMTIGCDVDSQPRPTAIGHVEVRKIDSKVTKITVTITRNGEYQLDTQQEADNLIAGLKIILSDLETARNEMKVDETKIEINP